MAGSTIYEDEIARWRSSNPDPTDKTHHMILTSMPETVLAVLARVGLVRNVCVTQL